MNHLYHKPYIQELRPNTESLEAVFPYPREELLKEPIFPYYILDGGAYFLANEYFGTADAETLCAKTMDGSLFERWTGKNGFDWDRSLTRSAGTDFIRELEWQVWLQRLYILLPLAQKWAQTGEKRYAEKWRELLHSWWEAHPYQAYEEGSKIEDTDYVWRDMQVVWRMQTLLHSVYLLGSRDGALERDDWRFLYDLIELHAEHELSEARHGLQGSGRGNHFQQLGVSLVTVGVMFPEFAHAKEYLEAGRSVVKKILQNEITPDGGSIEGSPSYSHFIARLYVECYLILKNNRLDEIEGLYESICAQYEFLYQFSTRDGKTLRFGDSYRMDVHADIERVKDLLSLKLSEHKETRLFPAIGCAVLRNEYFEVFVDNSVPATFHQHFGRPQIAVYAVGEQVISDSGCVNYDRHDLREFLKEPTSHNVVDTVKTRGAKPETAVTDFCETENRVRFTVKYAKNGVEWCNIRTIALCGKTIRITDDLEASEPLQFVSTLHFDAKDTRISEDGYTARQLLDNGVIVLKTSEPMKQSFQPAMGEDNRMTWTVRLTRELETAKATSTAELTLLQK